MDNATGLNLKLSAASKREYYARIGITDIAAAPSILFVLGLLIFIAGAVQWHIGIMTASLVIMFPGMKDYFNIRRNLGQPFIGLGVNSFWVGRRPKFYMPYTDVERYAFELNQSTRSRVAFSLFLKSGARLVGIKGGGPVELKEGRMVCRSVKLDRGVTAESFFVIFGSRLKTAGAVDALTDPEIAVRVNARTGNALVLPDGPLAALIIKIGAFLEVRQDSLKWLSWRLGSLGVLILFFALLCVSKEVAPH
ncbi:MAG: hypothetical protein LBV79_12320 [Candidatus Adiutrix sp.]|jgi:hypothetical protein|nr:hypothetical protein [Candidatus Adiutrix sp.]